MTIKSSQTLVSEALSKVKTITAEEALKLSNENKCTLIDIREKGELDKTGRIENSNHIPRGMLEFWLDPEGPYFKSGKIDMKKEMVLFLFLKVALVCVLCSKREINALPGLIGHHANGIRVYA